MGVTPSAGTFPFGFLFGPFGSQKWCVNVDLIFGLGFDLENGAKKVLKKFWFKDPGKKFLGL